VPTSLGTSERGIVTPVKSTGALLSAVKHELEQFGLVTAAALLICGERVFHA
jgi:hypothetical protein